MTHEHQRPLVGSPEDQRLREVSRVRRDRSLRGRAAFAMALSLLISLSGCVHATAGGSAVPGDQPTERDDTPIGPAAVESINELDARKDKLIGQVRGQMQAAAGDVKVCENVCSLASSVCEVQDKICDIADANAAHDEYLQLCREAKQECNEAQAACLACVDRFTQPR